MMNTYFGYDVGDTLVQKDQVYFDRLPSPDNWSNWGFGNSGPPYVFVDGDKMMSELSDERPPYQPDAELSYGSCSHVDSSQDSWPWNLQIDGFTGTESTDDMFLSSLILEDAPAAAHNYYPITLNSQPESAMMPPHGNSGGRMLDGQNMHCGTYSSMVFQTPSFSTSAGSNSRLSCVPNALESMDMILSDQVPDCEDLLSEESVLLGLEAVLSQLSIKTRLCFRDSLYRLAQCSQPSTSAQVSAEFPSLDRTRRTTTGESETNTIDRAVANLMFQNPNGQCRCT